MRWFLLLAVLIGAAAPAVADLKSCVSLYQNGPRTLGGYVRAKSKNYEKDSRGAGFSTTYGRKQGDRATVFYYTRKQRRPSFDVIVEELMQATGLAIELRLSVWAERGLGHYNPYEADTPFLAIEQVAEHPYPIAVQSRINMSPPGVAAAHDYVTLGVVNNCIVKLRYSTSGTQRAADGRFERIRADLLRHFSG